MKIVIKIFIIIFLLPVFSLSVSAQTPTIDKDFPRLTIVNPEDGSQILGSKVTVSFVVNNFIFVDFAKITKKTAGQGHMHLWLDEKNPTPENAQKITKATSITLEDVPPGSHKLVFELVNNDHTSFKPPVTQTVNLTTKSEIQQPSITVIPTNTETNEQQKGEIKMLTTIGVISTIGFLVFLLFAIVLLKRKNI